MKKSMGRCVARGKRQEVRGKKRKKVGADDYIDPKAGKKPCFSG